MKILFISHEATLTGAPLVLFNFLKWMKKKHPEIKSKLLFLKGGPRIGDFSNVYDTLIMPDSFKKYSKIFFLIKALSAKVGIKIQTEKEKFESYLINITPDIVYCNTVVTLEKGIDLCNKMIKKPKLLVHVHELPTVIELENKNFKSQALKVDLFIAVSRLVKQSLIEKYNIDEIRIRLIYEFVEPISESIQKYYSQRFCIGASGLVHWRKGHDVFLMIASRFTQKYPLEKVLFKWVGKISQEQRLIVEADIEKLGLSHSIVFTGETNQPIEEFKSFDLFLLTSREDPFPLVCLEVAQLGIPFICFETATGSAEMLQRGGGYVAKYFNIDDVCDKIYNYKVNFENWQKDSRIIKEESLNYQTAVLAPKLYKVLLEH
ncbi:MAG: glycosyltransferase [Cytophagales bacterium]